jgi:hypothetical protein
MKVTIKELIIESNDNIGGVYISFNNTESVNMKQNIVPYKTEPVNTQIISDPESDRPAMPLPPEMDNVEF